jgi:hypothetical protein
MAAQQEYFIKKLDEVTEQYLLTKEVIIFLEKYNRGNNSYLGPHNEVRNAYDHVMKMVISRGNTSEMEQQYIGAKSHLLRAGYDAYELLCSNCIAYINDTIKHFKPSDIKNGFPEYYSNGMRANIIEIQKELTGYRMRHPVENNVQDLGKHEVTEVHDASDLEKAQLNYSYYHKSAKQLLAYSDDMDRHVPDIDDFRKERVRKIRLAIAGFVVAAGGLIVAIARLFLC